MPPYGGASASPVHGEVAERSAVGGVAARERIAQQKKEEELK